MHLIHEIERASSSFCHRDFGFLIRFEIPYHILLERRMFYNLSRRKTHSDTKTEYQSILSSCELPLNVLQPVNVSSRGFEGQSDIETLGMRTDERKCSKIAHIETERYLASRRVFRLGWRFGRLPPGASLWLDPIIAIGGFLRIAKQCISCVTSLDFYKHQELAWR